MVFIFAGLLHLPVGFGVMHCRHWGVVAIFIVMIWDGM
jgi:hypothetical protein